MFEGHGENYTFNQMKEKGKTIHRKDLLSGFFIPKTPSCFLPKNGRFPAVENPQWETP
jgi:hypothetical protein